MRNRETYDSEADQRRQSRALNYLAETKRKLLEAQELHVDQSLKQRCKSSEAKEQRRKELEKEENWRKEPKNSERGRDRKRIEAEG